MELNIERLRNDLINYYGSASTIYPVALSNVIEVDSASDERLIEIALSNRFDLSRYEEEVKVKRL